MTDPLYLERQGHRTWLKWHRARRQATDTAFTGARILEAMRLGASTEVDLVIHADRGYAVLHDLTADRETTGTGPIVQLSAATLRGLHLRDDAGNAIPDHVMLLEDLADLLAHGGLHPDALLQLDYKEDAAALDERAIANFKQSIGPVAHCMILSSGDAEAVRLLTDGVPGLRIGYDPCHDGAIERLQQSRDYAGFVANAIAASPNAEMIYLEHRLVLGADQDGFDIVAAFHAANRRIDAYTIKDASAATKPQIEKLLALKVDQITADDPEGLLALLG